MLTAPATRKSSSNRRRNGKSKNKRRNYNYVRPWLYPKQSAAVFDDRRYSLIEATTKAGKTVACITWLAEKAMLGKQGQNYWWIAPIFAQAKIAFRRLKLGLPAHVYKANETELTITLANGAVIWFKGADKPDSLYGEDVYAAVIDEASRVKEEAWHAVRSTLTATRGHIRIIGNVKGRRNWFYKLARKAEAGAENMGYHKITAYDAIAAKILAQEEVDDAKAQLPDAVFKQLYEAEPADDEGNPFGYKAIKACIKALSDRLPVCYGIDLAKSTDWTVLVGLDEKGDVCRFYRWQKPWQDTIDEITKIAEGVPCLIDSTGVGDPIVEALQKKGRNFTGFKFSSTSKQQLMEGLAVAIQGKAISYPEGVIVDELEEFEYQFTRTGVRYSAPEGMHDDSVCALALAVWQLTHGKRGLLDFYKEQYEDLKQKQSAAAPASQADRFIG
jgi:phage FluMu gp28-like protein